MNKYHNYLKTCILATGCMFAKNTLAQQARIPASKHDPIVISHRADHTRKPENSIAAIQDAIRCGADYVEIDLRTTRDSFLVLSHDASLTRMTGAPGKVQELTLAEIKNLALKPTIPDGKTYRVPEFKDVLRCCKNKINIYLDFKEADVEKTWQQIRAAGMEDQIVVYCNHPSQYTDWRRIAPAMPILTSLPDDAKTAEAAIAFIDHTPVEVIDNAYDPAIRTALRKKGVAIWLDVQNADEGPVSWQKALDLGVQGLQTDHPEALIPWLKTKKGAK